jgi:hypothetical protein
MSDARSELYASRPTPGERIATAIEQHRGVWGLPVQLLARLIDEEIERQTSALTAHCEGLKDLLHQATEGMTEIAERLLTPREAGDRIPGGHRE